MRRSAGFTLIEVLAAFTILAMSFALVLQILSNSSGNTIKSSVRTRIALLAQSKMDEVGINIPIEEGAISGDFSDDMSWNIEISEYEASYEGESQPLINLVGLFKVDLTISWETGGELREARFSTLKAMDPNYQGERVGI